MIELFVSLVLPTRTMPLELQGFKAWISVDGEETPCYGIEKSEDGKAVTGWIASEEGKVRDQAPLQALPVSEHGSLDSLGYLEILCQVDDIKCRGVIMDEASSPTDIYFTDGLEISAATFAPFLFGSVKLTDDDSVLDASLSSSLGDISLSIWRTKLISVREFGPEVILPEQQIHERAKKAILHQVKLGDEEVRASEKNTYKTKRLDKQPLVTFTFKYRPLNVLEANVIVPPESAKRREMPVAHKSRNPDEPTDPHGTEAVQSAKLEADTSAPIPATKKRKARQEPKQESIDERVPDESAAAQVLAAQITVLEDEVESRQEELESRRAELLTRQAELDAGLDRLKARQEKLATLKAKHTAMVSKNTAFKRVKVEIDLT
ncbi:hypothetical protein HWV62_33123 [Athelia sp. TMB]|nr:hypothetical protein HWV62_33123 [Athelia sp. TMB]